jgi:hypothetical protein
MVQRIKEKMEQEFARLPEYGYSEKVTEIIWQWYHPSSADKSKSSPK